MNEEAKREYNEAEKQRKTQIAKFEKKAHSNWIACREAERNLEDANREISTLRMQLSDLQKPLIRPNPLAVSRGLQRSGQSPLPVKERYQRSESPHPMSNIRRSMSPSESFSEDHIQSEVSHRSRPSSVSNFSTDRSIRPFRRPLDGPFPPTDMRPPLDGPPPMRPPYDGPPPMRPPYDGPLPIRPPLDGPPPMRPPYDGPPPIRPPLDGPHLPLDGPFPPMGMQPPYDGPRLMRPPLDGPHSMRPPLNGPHQIRPPIQMMENLPRSGNQPPKTSSPLINAPPMRHLQRRPEPHMDNPSGPQPSSFPA